MIRVELVGKPNVEVEGSKYSISGSFSAYDEDNTVIASTTLSITGAVSEGKTKVKEKLAASAKTWRDKVQATENFKAKVM